MGQGQVDSTTQLDGLTPEILDRIPDLVAYWDRELRNVFANRAFHEFLGSPPGTIVGSHLRDVVTSEVLEQVTPVVERALAGFETAVERESVDRDGVSHHLRARYLPHWSDGNVVGFYVVAADVTDRVQAESERDEAQRLFQIAVEHAPIGKAVVTVEGRWLQINRAFCNLTGYTVEELMPTDVMKIIHPEDLATGTGAARFDEDDDASDFGTEVRLIRKGGEIIWVHRTAVVVPGVAPNGDVIIVQIQDISARKRAQEDLARLALSDPLTGLFNRLVLMDRLEHALAGARRRGTQVGVLFIDLDKFKQVNDVHGHARGDELLRQVAARLRRQTRDDDTSVRMGGDEFVVLVENVEDVRSVQQVAARIRDALNEVYDVDGVLISISASVGYTWGVGPSPEVLLRQADNAMYQAKASGHGQITLYDQTTQAVALDLFRLDEELRQALAKEEFRLLYQPIVELPAGTVVAREALIRWVHPRRGTLAPDAFLPAAERTRLVVPIGRWVMRQACRDAATWGDGAGVCVNVSAHELAAPDFPRFVRECLERTGLPPSLLLLEITESLVLTASESTLRATGELTDLGVSISLDDFGTGQSSITALHKLPVSALKIDRSFVAEVLTVDAASALVDGLIHLGIGMGLDVIAEGVETPDQANWLTDHGCPHAQGYLYGRPGPVERSA